MLRSPTVFEEVVKTICTTNCAWSGTVRMVSSLVEHLGAFLGGRVARTLWARVSDSRGDGVADVDFYRDIARAGYRGAYLRELATSVADGELDIEAFAAARTTSRTKSSRSACSRFPASAPTRRPTS